ncbi:MAG: PA2779 family protein [Candidatus Rokubacteria bacterium]|nr:PA2779 family protein [Candidatus Rokubacteria bacterium]
MSRPMLVHPRIVGPVALWAVLLGLLPRVAEAAPIPPTGAAHTDARTLETRLVAARLVALGVSPDEATARLAAMSDEERHALATRLDEIRTGGSPAGALAVAIIVGLLVVLVLELLGRRVISRP